MPIMLILRGIRTDEYPRGALEEEPAVEYARRMGYTAMVLDVPGTTGPDSPQAKLALETLRNHLDVSAIYGFSGGGYNVRHVINRLSGAERTRVNLVVVLGAPNNPKSLYAGPWQLVYRLDPPAGHMAGPRALLAEVSPPAIVPTPSLPQAEPVAIPGFWQAIGNMVKGWFSRKP